MLENNLQCALGSCPGLVLTELTTGLIHQQTCNTTSHAIFTGPCVPGLGVGSMLRYEFNLWKFRNLGLSSKDLYMDFVPEASANGCEFETILWTVLWSRVCK